MAHTSIHITDFRTQIPGGLTPDRSAWVFPTVSTTVSSGKQSDWTIRIRVFRLTPEINANDPPEHAFVPIEDSFFDSKPMDPMLRAWIKKFVGIEGNVNKNVPTIVHTGKSLKTKAATNVFTQALRDALGDYNKKTKKVHLVDKQTNKQEPIADDQANCTTTLYPPMLASNMKDIDVAFPAYVQKKYDGVRAVTTLNCTKNDDIELYTPIMYSRSKLLFPGFPYIKAELFPILQHYWKCGNKLYLDGEIYKHGARLQDISGDARREETKDTDIKYNYMIYDCFIANDPDMTYTIRKEILNLIFSGYLLEYSKPVTTHTVHSTDEIQIFFKEFLTEGFEGAIVRADDPYEYSYNAHHSRSLLKLKPTFDAEFKLIGWETGRKGKAAAALMVVCETNAGIKFNVTPAMEIPDRIALAKKMAEVEPNSKTHFENHWKDKWLIVYYDELSKDKVPQRARTKLELRRIGD